MIMQLSIITKTLGIFYNSIRLKWLYRLINSFAWTICILVSNQALASDIEFPTPIPANNVERQKIIKQISDQSTWSERKVAHLSELALLTSQQDTTVAQVISLEKRLLDLSKKRPDDAEVRAALGSTLSFKSSFYTNNLSKLSLYSSKGNRLMDRAVKSHPHHLGVRLQRGINNANMPTFVHRAHFAVMDLEMVRDHIGLKYGEEFKWFVEYYLAQAYSRNNQIPEAIKLWKKIGDTDSQWSIRSKLALKEF